MYRRKIYFVLLGLVLLLGLQHPVIAQEKFSVPQENTFAPIVQGIEIRDQFQEGIDYGFAFDSTLIQWQEFIPALYNMTAVEIYIQKSGSPGTLIVEIQELDGTVLGHTEIVDTSVAAYNWLRVDFTQFSVSPGTKYRIYVWADTVSPGPSNRFSWRGNTASTYCSGCINSVSGSWPDYDFAFRTYGVGIRRPVNSDFDGDRDTDISVYRPSNGKWYVYGQAPVSWGVPGDIPVPGVYSGCGFTDKAVFRPSNGKWYLQGLSPVSWGQPGDIPVQADYNGDGLTDIAVLRPSNGNWYIKDQGHISWHNSGDIPVPCDYSGDFMDEIAVYRPSNGKWYILGQVPISWGHSGDIPVPADYDGDGSCDIAVYRPSNGKWYIMGFGNIKWGLSGDIPVPGDYDGCGDAEIAVLRPSNGKWYIKDMGTFKWYGTGDYPLPVRDTNADGDPYEQQNARMIRQTTPLAEATRGVFVYHVAFGKNPRNGVFLTRLVILSYTDITLAIH